MVRASWITVAAVCAAMQLFGSVPAANADAALPTVHMRNMTWLDIKGAIAGGATTVIIPTGGIEQNGPHMVLGKHDYIVTSAADRIAANLGQTLVAPVVSFVPQGELNPPSGNMMFPGTIGISEAVFEQLLEGIARSLKHAGFKDIAIIGDHGMSQPAQAKVAVKLTREWSRDGVRVHQIDQYYEDAGQIAALQKQGETLATIGQHASLIDTAELMSIYPAGVDLGRLALPKGNLAAAGGSGDPARASITRGAELIKMRIEAATQQIRATVKR